MLIFYLNVALKNIFFCVSAPTSSLSTWTNWTSKLFLNINVTSISVILNGSWSSDVGPTYSKSLTVTCPLIAFLLFWAPIGYRLSLNVGCSRLLNNKMLTFANQTKQKRLVLISFKEIDEDGQWAMHLMFASLPFCLNGMLLLLFKKKLKKYIYQMPSEIHIWPCLPKRWNTV